MWKQSKSKFTFNSLDLPAIAVNRLTPRRAVSGFTTRPPCDIHTRIRLSTDLPAYLRFVVVHELLRSAYLQSLPILLTIRDRAISHRLSPKTRTITSSGSTGSLAVPIFRHR